MKKIIVVLILFVGMVAGCSSKNGEHHHETSPSLDQIEVTIQTPETINPNEEIVIQALVTQGSDKVDDANEVKFEIKKDGQESEMQKAKNDGKGVYSIKKTFTDNGKYSVTAHVTARSMHTMPTEEFTVGDVK